MQVIAQTGSICLQFNGLSLRANIYKNWLNDLLFPAFFRINPKTKIKIYKHMNNLPSTHEQVIETLEAQLSISHKKSHNLQEQNRSLNSKIQELAHENKNLSRLIKNDPLLNILNNSFQSEINQLQSQRQSRQQLLKSSEIYRSKILELENVQKMYETQIKQLRADVLNMQKDKINEEHMNSQLKAELSKEKQKNQALQQDVEQKANTIGEYSSNQKRLQDELIMLKKDNENVNLSFELQSDLYSRQLLSMSNSLINCSGYSASNMQSELFTQQKMDRSTYEELSNNWKTQKSIMQSLAKQLEARQEQISALLDLKKTHNNKNINGFMTTSQYAFKSEQIAKLLSHKHQQVNKLSEEFLHVKQLLEQSMQTQKDLMMQNKQLQREVNSQQSAVKRLNSTQKELNELRTSYNLLKKQIEDNDEQISDILLENQCYHNLMYEVYGKGRFIEVIQREKNAYMKRKAQRVGDGKNNTSLSERWTNVEELLKVNRDLRIKIRRGTN